MQSLNLCPSNSSRMPRMAVTNKTAQHRDKPTKVSGRAGQHDTHGNRKFKTMEDTALRQNIQTLEMDGCDRPLEEQPHPSLPSLPVELHELTKIVPLSSSALERTTVLTWMYHNNGTITVSELASRLQNGEGIIGLKRRSARRALAGLHKIGAVAYIGLADPEDTPDKEDECPANGENQRTETVSLTDKGMLWLHRAWRARQAANGPGSIHDLRYTHMVLLEEEEDGKGNEPYWLEGADRTGGDSIHCPKGIVSAWIRPQVSFVFDLGVCETTKSKRNKPTAKN